MPPPTARGDDKWDGLRRGCLIKTRTSLLRKSGRRKCFRPLSAWTSFKNPLAKRQVILSHPRWLPDRRQDGKMTERNALIAPTFPHRRAALINFTRMTFSVPTVVLLPFNTVTDNLCEHELFTKARHNDTTRCLFTQKRLFNFLPRSRLAGSRFVSLSRNRFVVSSHYEWIDISHAPGHRLKWSAHVSRVTLRAVDLRA